MVLRSHSYALLVLTVQLEPQLLPNVLQESTVIELVSQLQLTVRHAPKVTTASLEASHQLLVLLVNTMEILEVL